MTDYLPGDIVDVVIKGRIHWISSTIGHFQLNYGSEMETDDSQSIIIYPDEPGVTIFPKGEAVSSIKNLIEAATEIETQNIQLRSENAKLKHKLDDVLGGYAKEFYGEEK